MPRKNPRRFPKPPALLPSFQLANRFCYFYDLYTYDPNNEPMSAHKLALGNKAEKTFREVAAQLTSQKNKRKANSDIIKTAVSFLSQVAKNERSKEIAVVKYYVDYLKNMLPEGFTDNDDFNKLIERLEAFSNNPNNGDMDSFYNDLIICLNVIRNNFSDFSARLNQLLDTNRKTWEDLASDQYLFRVTGDISSTLNSLIGVGKKRDATSFANIMQNKLFDYIADNLQDRLKKSSEQDILALVTALVVDFEHFIQQRYPDGIDENGNKIKLDEFAKNAIDDLFEEYTNAQKPPTYLLQCLDSNEEALNNILNNVKRVMKFGTLAEKGKETTMRMRNFVNRRDRNAGYKKIVSKFFTNAQKRIIGRSTWINLNTKTTNVHGNIFEMVQTILNGGIKVRDHAATDILRGNIGELKIEFNIKEGTIINQYLDNIAEEITRFEQKERQGRLDSLTDDFKNMNNNIQNLEKQLETIIKKLEGPPKKLFIYHDSLKLYYSVETRDRSGFEGRALNILNTLDRIYSLNGIEGLTLPDQELMYNLCLNLAENAILNGEATKTVEDYFSIFAGMLMFDDIQNMALEIAKNVSTQLVSYSSLQNIHMYQLNDIYIPGSLLLTTVSEALQIALSHGYGEGTFSSGKAAIAVINTNGSNATINEWLDSGRDEMNWNDVTNDWSEQADKIAAGTTVQIVFLTSFISLLKSIQDRMS